MRTGLRRLWTAPVVALILFAGRIGYLDMRVHFVGIRQDDPTLHYWWTVVFCFYFLLFLVSVGIIGAIFKGMLPLRSTIQFVANIFVIWLLFGLASITGDPATLSLLSTIGLSGLRNWLFGIASIWVVLTIYLLLDETKNKLIANSK